MQSIVFAGFANLLRRHSVDDVLKFLYQINATETADPHKFTVLSKIDTQIVPLGINKVQNGESPK